MSKQMQVVVVVVVVVVASELSSQYLWKLMSFAWVDKGQTDAVSKNPS